MNKRHDQCKSKHFLIYKITNLDNGMTYIGKHQTYDPQDAYMGSSPYLNAAMQKHGLSQFKKEILFDFDNYDDMNSKEAELVNEDFIKRKDTYNTELGGNGGWNAVNDKPYKWICNPYLGKNKKLYEDTIPQCMASAGWTYGMLSKANMSSIEDIDGSVMPVKAFATKHKLKPYLVFQRLNAGWTTEEILSIPEENGVYRESKDQHKALIGQRISSKLRPYYDRRKQDTFEKNKKLAYEKYQQYIQLGKDKFKQACSSKEYRKWLDMFRRYVDEYEPKKASTVAFKIQYRGKCQSMSKWCEELSICKWSLYALTKAGKTFQEAFDMLLADPKCAPR